MKTVSVRDLQKKIRECVEESQTDRVVITRHGRPTAVLVGVEGQDWESVVLETNQAFWDLIEARRRQRTVPLSELRDED
jgi:prevent-host-death family protein